MKKDQNVDILTKSSPVDEPFEVILVDIAKAAEKILHCVKKPWQQDDDDDTVPFVALSYRWGELQETMIDTGLDYIAHIRSFDVNHFYKLCEMMTKEADVQHIKYVWVDAICIDQSNYKQRSATIHRMSDIYHRATFIIAVPDLHLQHLNTISAKNADLIKHCRDYGKEIYHLIHGNFQHLVATDHAFLDRIGVPKVPTARKALLEYTDYFTTNLLTYRYHHYRYRSHDVLDHLYETMQESSTNKTNDETIILSYNNEGRRRNYQAQMNKDGTIHLFLKKPPPPLAMQTMLGGDAMWEHKCLNADCPLVFFNAKRRPRSALHEDTKHPELFKHPWKELIVERHTIIQQSLEFFMDLIKDWSTRVWVISEYTIAKKKNNLKYWFLQMEINVDCGSAHLVDKVEEDHYMFFKFDFLNPRIDSTKERKLDNTAPYPGTILSTPIYRTFHRCMINQLSEQTFLDMILKSKASKQDDRFHSIFPLFAKYKKKITSKDQVIGWHLSTLVSVKLKLYELLDTKDKLNLLFLSGQFINTQPILPTFVTSTIQWHYAYVKSNLFDHTESFCCNFDLNREDTILFCQSYYLHVKPNEYHLLTDKDRLERAVYDFYKNNSNKLCKQLQLDESRDDLDVIYILHRRSTNAVQEQDKCMNYMIYLIGCFAKNTWVLCSDSAYIPMPFGDEWRLCCNNSIGFNIY